jgi:nucleotide-binding universal stress UspA family protein
MTQDTRPVIAAFDGSSESSAAVREAAALFGHRRIVVVTVWEPGLAAMVMSTPDVMGTPYGLPSVEEVERVDRIEHDHAASVAEAGARLARSLGATAEPLVVGEGVNVAETMIALAERYDAAAIVVGSRGLGGVRARLLGSVSRKLVHDAPRPVLVVRPRDDRSPDEDP